MTIYTPYTYLVGWSGLDKWYYGCEYGQLTKTAHPNNLWNTYFTSSKIVEQLRKRHGEPDVVQVRKTFTTAEACIDWEKKVQRRLDVLHNDKWLNINVAGASIQTEEIRRKKGEKIRATRKNRYVPAWNKGLTKETDTRVANYSENLKGKPSKLKGLQRTDQNKANLSQAMTGKKKSESHKAKLSIKMKSLVTPERRQFLSDIANRRLTCEYCGMESNRSNILRHQKKCSKN